MITGRVAFGFKADGFAIPALQSKAAVGWNDGVGEREGKALHAEMQTGALRSPQTTLLLHALRNSFGKDVPLENALLMWMAAIAEHPKHRDKERNKILDGVRNGTIPIVDFMPRPFVEDE